MKIVEMKQIISNEKVYPSSPTPHKLQTYKISMLDQANAPMPVPIIMYFPSNPKSSADTTFETRVQLLKSSLSVILTRFYPLAGRISKDGRSIDCKDEGVPFVVAKIEGKMMTDSRYNQARGPAQPCLLPLEIRWDTELGPGDNVAMIQVNHFECGGIAIGVVFWHKMGDAVTMINFMDSWAATARGSNKECICPNYLFQHLLPQNEEMQTQDGSLRPLLRVGKSVMRRFVFDSSAIKKLKEKSLVERPSRVEVVSALIWKCFMAASLANDKSTSLVTHAVNLRRRSQLPFASDCFGNFGGMAAASCTNGNEMDLGHLVREIRDAISKVNDDYVTRILGDQGFLGYCKNLEETWSNIPKEADFICISSWCNFGIYNVDFGWGKPIWVTRSDSGGDSESYFLNVVWLMDTRNGDGVEAWVTLEEKYMQVFDQIEELQTLASIDPNPVNSN
ncbi:limonoid 7-O-acetyltransferse-like [Primulina eburnea]|uniref:limonoid 7-O-acetyltransferse-like n=1 Tax=Primulina eburnea TaxID=1245227 RepID=UPI003C6BE569